MPVEVPKSAVPLEEAVRLFPTVRQSLLAKHDDCPLSTLFELKFARGWNTHPQARGTLFHRFAAAYLRELQAQEKKTLPLAVGYAILEETCHQQNVPPADIVRVPLRMMPELRMVVKKFVKDNQFSYWKIVDIEKRLSAKLSYPHPSGGFVERELTGQLDALLYEERGGDGAIVIDWKDTWALPPEPKERDPEEYVGEDDELRGISYHGYFQQRFYGWLVMKNFRNVNRVTLREFYARKTKARKATLTRDRLPEVEEELSYLVEAFDRAIAAGEPPWPIGFWPNPETGAPDDFDVERLGHWKPSPGRHCGFCAASRHCPLEEDVRIEAGGAITSWERAKRAAAELQVVERVRQVLIGGLKGFVETQGAPVPVKHSKGRRVIGWYQTKRGRRFGLFTPDESDRGGHPDLDAQLAEAMRQATKRARKERAPRRRRAGKA